MPVSLWKAPIGRGLGGASVQLHLQPFALLEPDGRALPGHLCQQGLLMNPLPDVEDHLDVTAVVRYRAA